MAVSGFNLWSYLRTVQKVTETEDKAPAFQFYTRDWLASSAVRMMTFAERGAYIDLLAYAWRDGGIPKDDSEIARLLQVPVRTWRRMSARVLEMFPDIDAELRTNPRQEVERAKLKAWRDKSSRGGRSTAKKRQAKATPKGNQSAATVSTKGPPKGHTALASTSALARRDTPAAANGEPVPSLIAEWVSRWEARYPGERWVVSGAKDGAGLKRLAGALGRGELLARMDRYLASSEAFHRERRHDLAVFVAQVNQFAKPTARKTSRDMSGIAAFAEKGATE